MILHQINRDTPAPIEENANLVTKAALIISTMLIAENGISGFVDLYRNMFLKWGEVEYLIWNKSRCPEDSPAYKAITSILYEFFQYDNFKHVYTHQSLHDFNELRKSVIEKKAAYKISIEKTMVEKKIFGLLKFFDQKRIFLQPIKDHNDENIEDPYIEWLRNIICRTSEIPVFESAQVLFPDSISLELLETDDFRGRMPDYIKIPLYRIPDISNLTYEELNCTRLNILRKVKEFNTNVEELRNDIINLEFTSEYIKVIDTMLRIKLKGYGELQKVIDNELYMQKALNSGAALTAEVSLGIAPLRNIASYYEISGMLKSYSSASLLNRIEADKLSGRCGVFMNISIVENEE